MSFGGDISGSSSDDMLGFSSNYMSGSSSDDTYLFFREVEIFIKLDYILNILTPENFDVLVDKIMKLQIGIITKDKFHDVVVLIFERAIEPNCPALYAKLCQRLADNKLQSKKAGKMGGKAIAQRASYFASCFRSILINKVELEFKDVCDCKDKENELQPLIEKIAECTDPERKLQLQATLEEKQLKIRRRSCGTVHFIGELFKRSMLHDFIIKYVMKELLDPSSEDKLECLCILLTTIGKKFESTPININTRGVLRFHSLEDVITKIKNIVDGKVESKISSRIRFILQDVIDLRINKWVLKKTDSDSKKMGREPQVKQQQYQQQQLSIKNKSLLSSSKDEKIGHENVECGGCGENPIVEDKKKNSTNDEPWTLIGKNAEEKNASPISDEEGAVGYSNNKTLVPQQDQQQQQQNQEKKKPETRVPKKKKKSKTQVHGKKKKPKTRAQIVYNKKSHINNAVIATGDSNELTNLESVDGDISQALDLMKLVE